MTKPWEIGERPSIAEIGAKVGGYPPDPYSDAWNARVLARRWHDRLRFVGEWKAWVAWDGTRWRPDDGAIAARAAMETVGEMFRIALDLPEISRRNALLEHAMKSESERARGAMVRDARSMLAISVAELDRDPWLLNTPSGTVDLQTGELRKHDPAELITRIAGAPFDPTAHSPGFDAFLARVQPDPAMRAFLQRLAGYWSTGVIREQILAFLQGGGANGKSTFIALVARALGEYAITGAPGLLIASHGERHPTELADLEGRRLVVCHETEKGAQLAESRIKQLTGGDTIKARGMGENFHEFRPTAKLALLSNPKPRIRGTDDGIRRRVKLIPWPIRIPDAEQNPAFGDELWAAEASGILNWIVQGALVWRKRGLTFPASVGDASKSYFAEQDVLGEFLADKCVIGPGEWEATSVLFAEYRAWCERRNEKPGELRAFSDDLTDRPGFERAQRRRDGKQTRGVAGIRLRRHDEPHLYTVPSVAQEQS